MGQKLPGLKGFCFKVLICLLAVQSGSVGVMLASDSIAQVVSVKKLAIDLRLENASTKEVFSAIEKQTTLKFSYDEKIIDPALRFSFHQMAVVAEILMEISSKSRLHFKQINNNIFVKSIKKKARQQAIEIIVEDRTVTGRVTDRDGEPLPGVNVLIQGTARGTITDADGRFSLEVPDNAVLNFSYVGYNSEIVEVGARSIIDIVLMEDIASLQEIVIIGYGEREKKDLTGAISSITADEIQQNQSLTPELAMQGRMPGVFVSNPGGDPTERPDIRIRGVGTFNNNDPLFVIDGVPITEFGASGNSASVDADRAEDIRGPVNIMNLINPNDIESISVLKDASAAAIYGSRAANGVILITTKRGRSGKPRVEFNATYGVKKINDTFDVLNTQQFTALMQEAYANVGRDLIGVFDPDSPEFLGNSETYDWQDALINDNATVQRYDMNVTGGNDYSTYYLGVAYSNDEGSLKFNETDRYTVTLNSDHKATKWLKIGQTARLAYMDVLQERSGNADFRAASTPPWQRIYNPDGSLAPIQDPETDSLFYGPATGWNYLGVAEQVDIGYEFWRFLGSGFVEIEPVKDLLIRGAVSYDWNQNVRTQYIDLDREFFRTGGLERPGDSYGERNSRNRNLLKEVTLTYRKTIDEHNFDLTLNASEQTFVAEGSAATDDSLLNSSKPEFIFVGDGTDNKSTSGWRDEGALVGYVGRLSYNYQSRYYVDVAVRRDGSSNFNDGYKWGTFPSFSAAWRISRENFMSNAGFINDLKIRGGWGQLGNQNVTPFSYIATINPNPRYSVGSSAGNGSIGNVVNAAFVGNFPVESLSWETTTTTSIGFDATLLNNSLTLTAEYYYRKTDDILQDVDLPFVAGVGSQTPFNIGEMRNRGIELNFNYSRKVGSVDVSIGGNLTTVDNEVLRRFNGVPADFGNERVEEGESFRFLYGFQTDGIIRNQEEADANIAYFGEDRGVQPGDVRFRDLFTSRSDGGKAPGPDSLLNPADRTYLGKTIAGHYYGFNIGASYQNFDLTVFFRGVGDVQRVNEIRRSGESMNEESNQLVSTLNRWTPDNRSATIPRAAIGDPARNGRFSDRWVEDAGFLRLQTLQLGYAVPNQVLEKIGASRLRVFAGVENVFVITDWSGVDPENDENPIPTTFLFGLNASF